MSIQARSQAAKLTSDHRQMRLAAWTGPAIVGLLATAAALISVDPSRGGPGVTCDELYYTVLAKRLVFAGRTEGVDFFQPDHIERNFPWREGGPPFHPPLGFWLIGWTHHLFDAQPADPNAASIVPARCTAAVTLGLLVALVGWMTSRAAGVIPGVAAAISTAVTPRLFGHAHLATIDLLVALFTFAAIFAVAEAAEGEGRRWRFGLAGVVWGLALLTKLSGIVIAAPVAVWLVWRLRRRAVAPLIFWTSAALATLFVGWPWLWLAPLSRFALFLSTATSRGTIHVFYFGQAWDDVAAPWHYAPIMFLVTMPLGILILGGVGVWTHPRTLLTDARTSLVLAAFVTVLGLFSWPGVPVYDGVRLFLILFPLWAYMAGLGVRWLLDRWPEAPAARRWRMWGGAALLVGQGVGIAVYHPFELSHYNALVLGLPGAERLGFETTYWGDSVQEAVLEQAAQRVAGECVVYGPNLAPFQAAGVAATSYELSMADVRLIGHDQPTPPSEDCRYAIVYRRRADWEMIAPRLQDAVVEAEVARQGVWLARLYRLATPGETNAVSDESSK